jgi:hypothetical protein
VNFVLQEKKSFWNHIFCSPGVIGLATGHGLDESRLPGQTGGFDQPSQTVVMRLKQA